MFDDVVAEDIVEVSDGFLFDLDGKGVVGLGVVLVSSDVVVLGPQLDDG